MLCPQAPGEVSILRLPEVSKSLHPPNRVTGTETLRMQEWSSHSLVCILGLDAGKLEASTSGLRDLPEAIDFAWHRTIVWPFFLLSEHNLLFF